jgi:sterol desaturase/sphingolipid hydroxylase (fatty acid hydroxylase superfamily)
VAVTEGPGFEGLTQGLEWLAAVAAIAIVAEIGVDLVRRRARNWRETLVNVALALPGEALNATVGVTVATTLLGALSLVAPARHGLEPWTWIAAFLAMDLAYYVGHRAEHRIRALWAHHSVHHSSEDFDLSTSGRIAWHDGLVTWAYAAPVVLLGFHPVQVLLVYQGLLLYQVWVHTRWIGRVPLLEGILNTPSAHRVHHASNAAYLDKNYGAVLMIWDRLFGTYAEEQASEPVRYGLTRPIGTVNPLVVNFGETAALLRDLGRGTWTERFWSVFGPPEWSREDGFARVAPRSTWRRRAPPAA